MQHDHVLKKFHFDLLTPTAESVVGEGSVGKIFSTMLLHLAMQHDYVLKKLNFNLLTPSPVSGGGGGLRAKLLPCCCICDSL